MTCITVSRQLGSLGSEIAKAAAEILGYAVIWRNLINEAARRAGAPEAALMTIDELNLLGLKPKPEEMENYHNAVRQVMEELSRQGGVVIIGRAGQMILKDRPGVYHVRVIAPAGIRVQRLADRKNLSTQAAREQILASDRTRKQYLRRYYQADWNDPDLYDLVLNTQHCSVEQGAEIVCCLAGKTS